MPVLKYEDLKGQRLNYGDTRGKKDVKVSSGSSKNYTALVLFSRTVFMAI